MFDIWYQCDSGLIPWSGIKTTTRDKSCRCSLSKMSEQKMPKSKALLSKIFIGMQIVYKFRSLDHFFLSIFNYTTKLTLLSMGWVNLCPEASIMPDIYQITCCAYNGSWNDESLINMQTYQVGFDRVSAVRKQKIYTFYYLCSTLILNEGSKVTLKEKFRALGAPGITVQGPM